MDSEPRELNRRGLNRLSYNQILNSYNPNEFANNLSNKNGGYNYEAQEERRNWNPKRPLPNQKRYYINQSVNQLLPPSSIHK